MNRNEIRRTLKSYFGAAKHNILFVRSKAGTIVDVEYEDFLPEIVVEREVRKLIGEEYLLNVKRECSERMMDEIHDFIGNGTDIRRIYFFLMQNLPVQNA